MTSENTEWSSWKDVRKRMSGQARREKYADATHFGYRE
jgi:hypothetical protein